VILIQPRARDLPARLSARRRRTGFRHRHHGASGARRLWLGAHRHGVGCGDAGCSLSWPREPVTGLGAGGSLGTCFRRQPCRGP
jgi:hypothetical protein